MSKINNEHHHTENIEEHLQKVQALLEKHGVALHLANRQEMPRKDRHTLVESLVHKK